MKPITKEQRHAIHHIFQRHRPLQSGETPQQLVQEEGWQFHYDEETNDAFWWNPRHPMLHYGDAMEIVEYFKLDQPATYRAFRKTVQQGYDCLMVQVSGMWIGIEKDGYSHT